MNLQTTVVYRRPVPDLRFAIGPGCRQSPPGQRLYSVPARAGYHVRRSSCFPDPVDASSPWKSNNRHHPQQRR